MFNLERIFELAREHRVKRLELVGSAARGVANPGDYDFLVEFEPLPPLEHGRDVSEFVRRAREAV